MRTKPPHKTPTQINLSHLMAKYTVQLNHTQMYNSCTGTNIVSPLLYSEFVNYTKWDKDERESNAR